MKTLTGASSVGLLLAMGMVFLLQLSGPGPIGLAVLSSVAIANILTFTVKKVWDIRKPKQDENPVEPNRA